MNRQKKRREIEELDSRLIKLHDEHPVLFNLIAFAIALPIALVVMLFVSFTCKYSR